MLEKLMRERLNVLIFKDDLLVGMEYIWLKPKYKRWAEAYEEIKGKLKKKSLVLLRPVTPESLSWAKFVYTKKIASRVSKKSKGRYG